MMQRAPSGMNTQPYTCVVLRDQADRDNLANAMLDMNKRKVKEAPVVVVFAADLEPSRRVPLIQERKLGHSDTPEEIEKIVNTLNKFSFEGADPQTPGYVPTIAWSYKQTILAAATFLYAAQAAGLSTCPMEGFDEANVRKVLEIPDRYSVPIVISCGYPKPGTQRAGSTLRLAPTDIFFDGKFGRSTDKLFEQ
uniref:Nitroreductase domain-containing protein n=1 Tax=Globisporangium ultimum (strain ATCC 200006 / CBS 805.95 / DAOM BR144) TaxID=431595 RepID=K3WSQ5_GLOUD